MDRLAPSREAGLAIVIPDGESHFALPVLTCLGRHPGHRVHVVASDPQARVRWSRYCASFTVVPADDLDARLALVRSVIERVRADVLLPVCETGAQLMQANARALREQVALAPFEGTLEIGDKWRLAEILGELGIPHPTTVLYTGDDTYRDRLPAFPVLIKPRRLSGGYGIREFADADSLASFLAAHPEMANETIIQALVPGQDIGASALCRDGEVLALTVQRPVSAGALGYRTATAVELIVHPQAAGLARQLFQALGWSGIANVDLRSDERDGSLSVLEVNPRYWSSLLASHAAGVDFPHLACMAALGVAFPAPRPRAQRFLQAKASLRAWGGALGGNRNVAPALHETIWPYLLADPMPHVMAALRSGR